MKKRFWIEGPGSFVLAIALALIVRWAFYEAYVIPSSSMMPTLFTHDHLFVNKFVYGVRWPFTQSWILSWASPKRGDLVIFRRSSKDEEFTLKRVLAVPGDRVFIDHENIYINESLVEKRTPNAAQMAEVSAILDEATKKDYNLWMQTLGSKEFGVLYKKKQTPLSPFGPIEVPFDHYFVIGDHRDSSDDSRTWDQNRFVSRSEIIGRASLIWLSCDETLPAVSFLCNPLTIRWSRVFKAIQ